MFCLIIIRMLRFPTIVKPHTTCRPQFQTIDSTFILSFVQKILSKVLILCIISIQPLANQIRETIRITLEYLYHSVIRITCSSLQKQRRHKKSDEERWRKGSKLSKTFSFVTILMWFAKFLLLWRGRRGGSRGKEPNLIVSVSLTQLDLQ